MSLNVIGSGSKSIDAIVKAVKLVQVAGYLKEPAQCAGQILYDNNDLFLRRVIHGDVALITSVFAIARSKAEKAGLKKYIELFYPVIINTDGVAKWRRTPQVDIESTANMLIDYDLFKRLGGLNSEITIEQLNQIRCEISAIAHDWRRYLTSFVRWPTTNAPPSLASLLDSGWVKAGMLSHYGYHVGQDGQPTASRVKTLAKIFNAELNIDLFEKRYISEWSTPSSLGRLMKMARTIAALCRNAKRSPHNFNQAINDWEQDLEHLRQTYYHTFLNLEALSWPDTN
ncbi:hypothetical protein [Pseudomonas chlororaphis]|uniref:hypothetical protein n=1 Tax=Pseudomonas chlororaphis TaxID=587753 RepID=UPI0039E64D32